MADTNWILRFTPDCYFPMPVPAPVPLYQCRTNYVRSVQLYFECVSRSLARSPDHLSICPSAIILLDSLASCLAVPSIHGTPRALSGQQRPGHPRPRVFHSGLP